MNRDKLDIADIPIAMVTAQYLEYLDFMHTLDLAVAGEYLVMAVMAATLIQIKSRMLLRGLSRLALKTTPDSR
ncbi:MAG: segregation/condensation protein A [Dissulfurimicrobium sp.]|uniref:segregation/condensation protein A n=1 Tax=Dissulfurimicrobium sp. TaxID=2022436 RepID=UPI0040499B29